MRETTPLTCSEFFCSYASAHIYATLSKSGSKHASLGPFIHEPKSSFSSDVILAAEGVYEARTLYTLLKSPIVSTPSRMRIVPIEPGKPPEARISDEFCAASRYVLSEPSPINVLNRGRNSLRLSYEPVIEAICTE